MAWYASLQGIQSRGATTARPGSLAGLHQARREHAGQFFTPPTLVRFLWTMVEDLESKWRSKYGLAGEKFAIYDNSCGVGHMFWPASPDRHILYGVDIDGDAIAALGDAAKAAGFEATFLNAGMEEVTKAKANLALINPPFGIHLNSPFIEHAEGITTHGKFGPDTSALSQAFAIRQALDVAQVVIAVIPQSYEAALLQTPALAHACQAIIELPARLFQEQGTDVRVSVVVLAQGQYRPYSRHVVDSIDSKIAGFVPTAHNYPGRPKEPQVGEVDDDAPSITEPVTGDNRVFVTHSGRKIHLRFCDGLTQSKVLNAIHRERVTHQPDGPRIATGVKYTGQGWLDIENLLIAPDASTKLQELLDAIASAGGHPIADASLVNYYKKRLKTDTIRRTPFRRWANVDGAPDLTALRVGEVFAARVTLDHVIDPMNWCSPVLKAGKPVSVEVVSTSTGRGYEISGGEAGSTGLAVHALESFGKHFSADLPSAKGWRLIHEGRRVAFPELAACRTRLADALDLRRHLTWDPSSTEDCYQFDDLIELSMSPRGVGAWDMAAGKSRLAIALCLLGGAHNLICCEAHLVPEIVEEIEKMGLSRDLWQVLDNPRQLDSLKKVNLISYTRLRSPLYQSSRQTNDAEPAQPDATQPARRPRTTSGRRTWARRLRRKLHTVVADEAHILANRYTDQSRALWMLSPKRRYGMTGTAIPTYCRNALPLLIWAGGDGVSCQPYGEYQPFITPINLSSMQYSQRGMDVFRERHVSLEWAVKEFTEDLTRGAKREVPRLRNVEAFRDLLAPHLLRRVQGEPELAKWITVPEPTRFVHQIDWDPDHLRRYLITAWEFASWYRDQITRSGEKGKNVNLISLLAHMNEVCKAANIPHELGGPAGAFTGITTKQLAAANMLQKFTEQGRKSVVFATNPSAMRRIASLLDQSGIESVMYTGERSVSARTAELKRRFKNGPAPVCFITYGAGETGLNLPQASRVLFYNRFWTPKTEEQAGRRTVRPQQLLDVEYHYLHLRGGVDDYQAMMVEQKDDSIKAGLDYGDQEISEGEFLHLSTILGRFCDDLVERWGVKSHHDLLGALSNAA